MCARLYKSNRMRQCRFDQYIRANKLSYENNKEVPSYRFGLDLVELQRVAVFLVDDVELVLVTHADLVVAAQAVYERHGLRALERLQLLGEQYKDSV